MTTNRPKNDDAPENEPTFMGPAVPRVPEDRSQESTDPPEGSPRNAPDLITTQSAVRRACGVEIKNKGRMLQEVQALEALQREYLPEPGKAVESVQPEIPWEECLRDDEKQTIDFKKALRLLREVQSSSSPELALAIAADPVTEGPFIIPIIEADNERDLELVLSDNLKELRCPKKVRKNLLTRLKRAYKANSRKLFKEHKEIELQGIELTLKDVFTALEKITNPGKGLSGEAQESEIAEVGKLRGKAEDLFKKAAQHIERGQRTFSGIRIQINRQQPRSYFREQNKESTIQFTLFLHSIGIIDLNEEINSPTFIELLNIVRRTNNAAMGFLKTLDAKYKKIQARALAGLKNLIGDEGEIPTDTLDMVRDFANYTFPELIQFATDPSQRKGYRNHAAMLANTRLKVMTIMLSGHYMHAAEVAYKFREAITAPDLWDEDEDGHFKEVTHKIYSNGRGDYSSQKQDEFRNPERVVCRQWTSPLSGKTHDVRIVDGLEKTLKAIIMKMLLKNSKANPEKLFDLVRQTVVFMNIDDFNNEIDKRDVYYFLYTIGSKYGLKFVSEDADYLNQINWWKTHTTDEIYRHFVHRRTMERHSRAEAAEGARSKIRKGLEDIPESEEVSAEENKAREDEAAIEALKTHGGYCTVEDKSQNRPNHNSHSTDIKLIGRDDECGTGFELQALTGKDQVRNISISRKEAHENYKARQILELVMLRAQPHINLPTWHVVSMCQHMMRKAEAEFEARELQNALRNAEIALIREKDGKRISKEEYDQIFEETISPLTDKKEELQREARKERQKAEAHKEKYIRRLS